MNTNIQVTYKNVIENVKIDNSFKVVLQRFITVVVRDMFEDREVKLTEVIVGDINKNLLEYIPKKYGIEISQETMDERKNSIAKGVFFSHEEKDVFIIMLDIVNVIQDMLNKKKDINGENLLFEMKSTFVHELVHFFDYMVKMELEKEQKLNHDQFIGYSYLWTEYHAYRVGNELKLPVGSYEYVNVEDVERLIDYTYKLEKDEHSKAFRQLMDFFVRLCSVTDKERINIILNNESVVKLFDGKLRETIELLDEFYLNRKLSKYPYYLELLGKKYIELLRVFMNNLS